VPEVPVVPAVPGTGGRKAHEPSGTSTRAASPKDRRVNRYLRRHYSSGITESDAWYQHVAGVRVTGTTTTLATDLPNDRNGKSLANRICVDVRGGIPGLTDSVRVKGAEGEMLANCVP
jgi:hypothetical protein